MLLSPRITALFFLLSSIYICISENSENVHNYFACQLQHLCTPDPGKNSRKDDLVPSCLPSRAFTKNNQAINIFRRLLPLQWTAHPTAIWKKGSLEYMSEPQDCLTAFSSEWIWWSSGVPDDNQGNFTIIPSVRCWRVQTTVTVWPLKSLAQIREWSHSISVLTFLCDSYEDILRHIK